MKQYQVTGMSCAACSARVEKAVNAVDGVTACAVNLLTNSMGVEGTASESEIIAAVKQAGYGASVSRANNNRMSNPNVIEASKDDPINQTTQRMKRRLFTSLGFLILLMYVSMGHMMWGFPIPDFLEQNPLAQGLFQMLLTIVVMVINQQFFISGYKSLWKKAPNMDSLVALGSSAAFAYSTYALFLMADAAIVGDITQVYAYMQEMYFESSAMILTLITVGKMLEARSKGKTTDALKSLMDLSPKTATILQTKQEEITEIVVAVTEVKKGDIFVVRPGEVIPVDGIIVDGMSAINEAALTGESVPVDKATGDNVFAATLNQSGFLKCQATRVGEDTTLSQIIQMVSDAAATKAPIAKVADRVSGVFVPIVITIAIVTTVIWLLTGATLGYALARGISVLVISCPCALGLATPVAIMVGSGVGARNNILFKTATSLEKMGQVDIIALDKTGTITKGQPTVTDIIINEEDGITQEKLVSFAYSLERKSEHPLAKAICQYGVEKQLNSADVSDFSVLPGNGLMGEIDGSKAYGGNASFIAQMGISIPKELECRAEQLAQVGKTPLYFAENGTLLGIIAVADIMKDDSKEAIGQLKNMGIHVVMLTGDNEKTAKAIGQIAGVDTVIAEVLPDGKEQEIKKLLQQGTVAMVGDGINDAPALTRADVGIAIGAGTDVAIDAADVVLMKSRLSDVAAAVRLSRHTLRNIHQNLFWAFFYNLLGIPLAAGIWIPLFGWEMNPMFGAAAMSLSSFCVVTNALRLNRVNVHDAKIDDRSKRLKKNNERMMRVKNTCIEQTKKMEEKSMERTMKIEGMMCGHCEARVKKTLEALPQVAEAIVSHTEGTAIVKLSADISNEELKQVIEAQDYTVLDIQ